MVPLYAARVQDLGPEDVAVFKCGACGHTAGACRKVFQISVRAVWEGDMAQLLVMDRALRRPNFGTVNLSQAGPCS